MEIEVRQCGAVSVVKPIGAIKGSDADKVAATLNEAIRVNLGRVVLDASSVPMIDSQGLGAMVGVTRELAQSGKPLKLSAMSETVRQVFELTGISPLFEMFDDANSAVRSYL